MGFVRESDSVSVNDNKVPAITEASEDNYETFTSTDSGSDSKSDIESKVEHIVRLILLTLTASDDEETAIRKATV